MVVVGVGGRRRMNFYFYFLVEASPEPNRMFSKRSVEKL